MISCSQARHLFDAFLDDELPPNLRAEVHAHRLSCPPCSHELAILEACADVIRTDRREPRLHEDFTDRVMTAFGNRKQPARHTWQRIAIFAGSPLAAAAVLVFAITTSLRPPSGTVRPREIRADVERLPAAIARDLPGRPMESMTVAERVQFEQASEVPVKEVLEAMLYPAIERTNRTLAQTRQSASQLAGMVADSFHFVPPLPAVEPAPAIDRVADADRPHGAASERRIGADAPPVEGLPDEFDIIEPSDQYPTSPVQTPTPEEIEVM